MKEYEYSIIRRVSRNPKRNREGRGVSESDLEALRQELAGDQRTREESMREELTEGVGELTLSAEELRKRLETAEGSLAGKLDSEAFTQWQTGDYAKSQSSLEEELRKKLGSEDFSKWQEGDFTSQLATSAQQTLAEALKRAGEMDKEIKVGGRNLIVTSRWKAGYLYGDRDENAYPVGSENYKVFVGYDTFRFDPVYIPTLGEREVTFKLYDNGGVSNGTVQIHAYDKDKKFLWWSCDGWDGSVGHTNTWTLPAETAYIRLGVTNEKVRAKVEFGAIVTDWTPAPEDVAESVSKVNTSLASLASTLLDPEQGEIHKLTSLLESHKTATDKSFATLTSNLAGKLDSGAFSKWREGDFKQALATKQPAGSYALTSELVTSAQQTLAEAVKQAGEMDKKVTEETNQAVTKLTASWQDVDQRVGDIYHWAAEKSSEMDSITKWQRETAPTITDLSSRSLTLQQKQDLGLLTSALRLKMAGGDGDKKTLEGLALLKYIALSGNNNDISAYLASDTLGAVLKAGITGFGTPQEREQVEITHQGTGHFGNLYFTGSQIDFRTSKDADPYLSMGAEENQFISEFLATARLDDTPVTVGTVTLSEQSTVYERTVSADHDGTRLTVTIDELEVAVYETAKVRLLLDNDVLGTWMGITSFREGGGGILNGVPDFRTEHTPYKGSNLSYERVVKAGSHTLRLEIVGKMDSGGSGTTVKGLRIKRRYDTGRQQSAFAKNGLRLFGSPDRYFDVDYREKYSKVVRYYYGLPITEFVPNPYLVRIKGGLQVDELDTPGVPLCGASFDENGSQIKAFGKRAKKRGSSRAQAVYYDNGRFFRVYHSIGHTNYLPTVQVIGDDGNDINWNLTARIYAVNANDFAVRIITNGDNPIKHAFSFVAFKTM